MTETAHSKRGTPSSSWFALACGASPDDPHSTCITRVAHARSSMDGHDRTLSTPPILRPRSVYSSTTSHPVFPPTVVWFRRRPLRVVVGSDGRGGESTVVGHRPGSSRLAVEHTHTHTQTRTWWRATCGRRSECRRVDARGSWKHAVERCTVDAQSIHVVVEVGGWNEHVPTQVERCRGRSQSDGDGQPRTTRTGPGKDPLGRFVRA